MNPTAGELMEKYMEQTGSSSLLAGAEIVILCAIVTVLFFMTCFLGLQTIWWWNHHK